MLNGIWVPQGAEFSGESIPMPPTRFIITGDRYRVESEGGDDEGVLVIDTEVTPHAVDITGMTGPNAGKTLRAIFRMRGDLLQLCYEVSEVPRRPGGFSTTRGSLQILVRYRREK